MYNYFEVVGRPPFGRGGAKKTRLVLSGTDERNTVVRAQEQYDFEVDSIRKIDLKQSNTSPLVVKYVVNNGTDRPLSSPKHNPFHEVYERIGVSKKAWGNAYFLYDSDSRTITLGNDERDVASIYYIDYSSKIKFDLPIDIHTNAIEALSQDKELQFWLDCYDQVHSQLLGLIEAAPGMFEFKSCIDIKREIDSFLKTKYWQTESKFDNYLNLITDSCNREQVKEILNCLETDYNNRLIKMDGGQWANISNVVGIKTLSFKGNQKVSRHIPSPSI